MQAAQFDGVSRIPMANRRILQFASAGFVAAAALQAVGYGIDCAAAHNGLGSQVLYNWLSLLFAPVSLLPRLTNPDAPLFGSWSTALLVVISNTAYYAAICKALQLFFLRLSRTLPAGKAAVVKPYSAPTVRHISGPALELNNF